MARRGPAAETCLTEQVNGPCLHDSGCSEAGALHLQGLEQKAPWAPEKLVKLPLRLGGDDSAGYLFILFQFTWIHMFPQGDFPLQRYYCAKSYDGYSKCYSPCPSMCERTGRAQRKAVYALKGGKIFMCGGKHENTWLDRYYKDQEHRKTKEKRKRKRGKRRKKTKERKQNKNKKT